VIGTVQEVVDDMRTRSEDRRGFDLLVPALSDRRIARGAADAKRVVVLEKCLAVGLGGIVSDGVRKSLSGIQLKGYTVIAGLGAGRSPAARCGNCSTTRSPTSSSR
jgi:pyruvate ferredoxin oxidoreductase alpha subunit